MKRDQGWIRSQVQGMLFVGMLSVASLTGCLVGDEPVTTPAVSASPTAIPTLPVVTPTSHTDSPPPTSAAASPAAENTPAPSQPGTYVVQAGDTVYDIAVRFNVDMQALIEANNITDPSAIQVGQELVIPK